MHWDEWLGYIVKFWYSATWVAKPGGICSLRSNNAGIGVSMGITIYQHQRGRNKYCDANSPFVTVAIATSEPTFLGVKHGKS